MLRGALRGSAFGDFSPGGPDDMDSGKPTVNVQPYTLIDINGQAFWLCRSDTAFLAVRAGEIGDYFRLTVLRRKFQRCTIQFLPRINPSR